MYRKVWINYRSIKGVDFKLKRFLRVAVHQGSGLQTAFSLPPTAGRREITEKSAHDGFTKISTAVTRRDPAG